MILGIIADDFTGGTDIASFLVAGGMSTVQLIGVPDDQAAVPDTDAVVISLKSRSCPAEDAVRDSLKAADYLLENGCKQIFFKYCSTFDSTKEGNIGPVAEALSNKLGCKFTVFSPALPVNGRTVYNGYLFVKGELLSESPMRNHPVNPMRDSNVMRLLQAQSKASCGLISHEVITRGEEAIKAQIRSLMQEGKAFAVADAIDNDDLLAQAQVFKDLPLVTGGSGLGWALAKAFKNNDGDIVSAVKKGAPAKGKCAVLSGSCSAMTLEQIQYYKKLAPSIAVDIDQCAVNDLKTEAYAQSIAEFMNENAGGNLAPLVYASADPEKLALIQQRYGAKASSLFIENFFYILSGKLKRFGFSKYIVAGGETSGQVTKALGVKGFHIGPTIAPGVPWVRSLDGQLSLALKSGNFGDRNFFEYAQVKF